MATLIITRPPQFLDPWFNEIEQVWDEIEAANNDQETRIISLESAIVSDVVTSVSADGEPQLQGDVILDSSGAITLNQVGNTITIGGGGVTDHGGLTGLLDDDHTQYLLADGTRAVTGDMSFSNNQALAFRMENLGSAPSPGNQGRIIFRTDTLTAQVDTGASFVNIGVNDHGALTGLLDDDHTQYLLVDGTRAVTGDLTINGKYLNEASEPLNMESAEADSGTAVAYIFDTTNPLVTAGALHSSFRVDGVEIFSIDKDGVISGGLSSVDSISVLIDTDNDSVVEEFTVEHNSPTTGAGEVLLRLNETGEMQLPVGTAGLRIGSAGVPSDPLDIDGTGNISGNLSLGANLLFETAALISSISDLTWQIDSNDDETSQFNWQDGSGADIMTLDENGDLTLTGTLIGGSSPFNMESKEQDLGGAIGFNLNTQIELTASDAKILNLQNNGVDVWSIDKDGDVAGNPFVVVDASEGATGITNAFTKLTSLYSGGIIQLTAGVFDVSNGIEITGQPINDIVIQGLGDLTILRHTGAANTNPTLSILGNTITASEPVDNISVDDTSITITTIANAANYLVGDTIILSGTDSDTGREEEEIHEVAVDGVPGTGVVEITRQISRNMTSVSARHFRDLNNLIIKDIAVERSAASGIGPGLNILNANNICIENIKVSPQDPNGTTLGAGILIDASTKGQIKNCRINEATTEGIEYTHCFDSKVINCYTEDTSTTAVDNAAIKIHSGSHNIEINNNTIKNSGQKGIYIHNELSGNPVGQCSDIKVWNNYIEEAETEGIDAGENRECNIKGNTMIQCLGILGTGLTNSLIIDNIIDPRSATGSHGIELNDSGTTPSTDCILSNNIIINAAVDGIRLEGVSDCLISSNRITGSSGDGIGLEDATNTCDQNMINNNHLRGNTGSAIDDNSTGVNNDVLDNKA